MHIGCEKYIFCDKEEELIRKIFGERKSVFFGGEEKWRRKRRKIFGKENSLTGRSKRKKIPGIGHYPLGPTIIALKLQGAGTITFLAIRNTIIFNGPAVAPLKIQLLGLCNDYWPLLRHPAPSFGRYFF